jgi:predicted GIY-YIG superfamily endonuclease
MEKWHVYQLRSDTELLYVGYTRRFGCRLREHSRQKSWWPEVTDVRSDEFTSEDEARQREKEIWASERPKYNKHSPFRTDEERRDYIARNQPKFDRSPKGRERTRRYNQSPKGRERARRYQQKNGEALAARQRLYRARRWQQPGPGLF